MVLTMVKDEQAPLTEQKKDSGRSSDKKEGNIPPLMEQATKVMPSTH